jgi:hypothetical protein
LFTAKIGEILPVYWQIAIPGNIIGAMRPGAQMSDYMTSAASNTANTEQLFSVPYAP